MHPSGLAMRDDERFLGGSMLWVSQASSACGTCMAIDRMLLSTVEDEGAQLACSYGGS